MRNHHQGIRHFVAIIQLSITSVILSGCSGGGGSDQTSFTAGPSTDGCDLSAAEITATFALPTECIDQFPQPDDNFDGRLYIMGSQVEAASGDLVLYAHGLDGGGAPLSVSDLQQATIQVGPASYVNADAEVDIQPVTPGDKILSLSLVTDYSESMSDSDLDAITDVYTTILDNLPEVYEASVINFSSTVQIPIRLDWTEAYTDSGNLIQQAIQRDESITRGNTALYDAMGYALQQDPAIIGGAAPVEGDGLVERCRPGHLLLVFTDGLENASYAYTKPQLINLIASSNTETIMLGTEEATKADLIELAGDNGAFVYAYNAAFVGDVIENWASSLANMVKITIAPSTLFASRDVSISLGTEVTDFTPPSDGLCEVP